MGTGETFHAYYSLGNSALPSAWPLYVHSKSLPFPCVTFCTPSLPYLYSTLGTQSVVYDDAFDIVKEHFPTAVQNGVFSKGASQPTLAVKWDAKETETRFGMRFITFEDMVVDVAGQYLERRIKDFMI